MVKRYWFGLNLEDNFGCQNIGVTAGSLEEAKKLVKLYLQQANAPDKLKSFKSDMKIIEDIDIRLLDQNHVVPNMGPVIFKGIWFPCLNL